MIKAQHHPFFVWFFRIYTLLMIRYHFKSADIRGQFNDRGLPVLMIGNHFSWWDGFFAYLVNIRILKRRFHIMMLEEELKNRKFLNKAGAYSISKKSRSVMESLAYSAGLLEDDRNTVAIYPQGAFQSVYHKPVIFEKGVQVIATKAKKDFQLVFYVALIDYFSSRKPMLTIYITEITRPVSLETTELERAYNSFLDDCYRQQQPG